MSSLPKPPHVIGIDLGTTYSCVAVLKNNKVEIILNEQGKNTTPSYVAFTDEERFIGFEAKSQCARNPKNTVYDVKRLIGRRFDDPMVTSDRKNWTFDVVPNGDKPMISVQFKNEPKLFSTEEISGMILGKMKEIAEAFLGEKVHDAVVTIPAYYDTSQRQATKDAAKIAGLNVLKIISEPTAAAIAYGLINNIDDERNVLIYDLGGGTFDVSMVAIKSHEITVKSKAGDTHLGGEDFDSRMVDHFITEFQRKHNVDMRPDKRAVGRLRLKCEEMKCTLSTTVKVNVELDCLFGGHDLSGTITRARFEELNEDLFKKTLRDVEKCLKDAGINRKDIDDVVLVGGSTRIPKVQELVQGYFNGKQLNKSINPDEAVAYGAALQAAHLSDYGTDIDPPLQVIDVVPLSLGTDISGGRMSVILKRNTPIPTKKTCSYSTTVDNQNSLGISVYEGEREFVAENKRLGEFVLKNLPPKPPGVPIIDVTYEIDADGILHVSAIERGTKNRDQITISDYVGRLSDPEVARMIAEAKQWTDEDEKDRERAEARDKLERYVNGIKSTMKEVSGGDKSDRDEVDNMCAKMISWLQTNESAEKDKLDDRQKELELKCEPIITKLKTVR